MTYCVTTKLRRARKPRAACGGYCPVIKPGEQYLEHTEFPGGESGFADAAGHPVRMAECYACAAQAGRGHLFTDGKDNWEVSDR